MGRGSRADAGQTDRLAMIADLLGGEAKGLTAKEVRAAWEEQVEAAVPSARTVEKDLRDGVTTGRWRRTGDGRKGSPYRYVAANVSIRATSSSIGARIESKGAVATETEGVTR